MKSALGSQTSCAAPLFLFLRPREIIVYYVYVLKSKKDGNFYVGCTGNLRKRFSEHNNGDVPSSRHRLPFELVYYEASRSRSDALHREKYLKTTYGKRYIRTRLKGDLFI
jgi:putative endonuclease